MRRVLSTGSNLAPGVALAYQACRKYSVGFCTAGQLVTDLAEASQQGRLSSLQTRPLKADLLVIDELSYLTSGRPSAELLFQVIPSRHEWGNVLITTNLPFSR